MNQLSIQILLVNFISAALISVIIYFSNKEVRCCNPIIMFIISSLGTFLGSSFVFFLPNFNIYFNSFILKNIIMTIPGILLSILFVFIWLKGSKSESYF